MNATNGDFGCHIFKNLKTQQLKSQYIFPLLLFVPKLEIYKYIIQQFTTSKPQSVLNYTL